MLGCWNLRQNRGDEVKPGLRALDGASVLGLMECNGNHQAIDEWREGKYPTRITGTGGPESRSTSLLVARGVTVHARGLIVAKAAWKGPYRGHHAGRVFPWATATIENRRVTVCVVHMSWSRTRNPLAWLACLRALLAFVRATEGPVVLMGDFNLTWGQRGTGAIRRLAKWSGLRHVPTGAPIDYALVRGIRLKGRKIGSFGSDHPAVEYD